MYHKIKKGIVDSFQVKKVPIYFHVPVLASFCIGLPLLVALYLGNITAGLTASMAALIVLYFDINASIEKRIITLLTCSFLFILSYSVGLIFSFNHVVSALIFGLFSMLMHWMSLYLKFRPPKSFFFIMLAATASCIPYNIEKIPERVGLIALGAIFTASFAFIYSLIVNKKSNQQISNQIHISKNPYADFLEALIIGFFMFACLQIGFMLKITNPYWIPVSCCAIMQGVSRQHVFQRAVQRICGTFFGLILCWLILLFAKNMLIVCILIMILQFLLESFIPKNYAIAMIFITPLTILLAEASDSIINNANYFIFIRFSNIVLGSLIGLIGGWLIHYEKIKYNKPI